MKLEEILDLQAKDLLKKKVFVSLATNAEHAVKLVQKKQKEIFGNNPMLQKFPVYCDRSGANMEYLTKDGVWQARYQDQSYDIKCDVEDIFNYFLMEYLIDHNLVTESNPCYVVIFQKAYVCRNYFRKFLRELSL